MIPDEFTSAEGEDGDPHGTDPACSDENSTAIRSPSVIARPAWCAIVVTGHRIGSSRCVPGHREIALPPRTCRTRSRALGESVEHMLSV